MFHADNRFKREYLRIQRAIYTLRHPTGLDDVATLATIRRDLLRLFDDAEIYALFDRGLVLAHREHRNRYPVEDIELDVIEEVLSDFLRVNLATPALHAILDRRHRADHRVETGEHEHYIRALDEYGNMHAFAADRDIYDRGSCRPRTH